MAAAMVLCQLTLSPSLYMCTIQSSDRIMDTGQVHSEGVVLRSCEQHAHGRPIRPGCALTSRSVAPRARGPRACLSRQDR